MDYTWKNNQPVICHPIGYVNREANAEGAEAGDARIILDPSLIPGLEGLIPGQRILVLFYFDRSQGYNLLQHPRGDTSAPKRGVFTLRSPRRPNSIGLTEVEVVAIHGNVLWVRGLDAFDDTPVLDIKPV
jgi:tRNA-Thr(GGU) m(6)t(6)A37 methyltransferase TsaA